MKTEMQLYGKGKIIDIKPTESGLQFEIYFDYRNNESFHLLDEEAIMFAQIINISLGKENTLEPKERITKE